MTGCHSATTKLAHDNEMHLSTQSRLVEKRKLYNCMTDRLIVLAVYEIWSTLLLIGTFIPLSPFPSRLGSHSHSAVFPGTCGQCTVAPCGLSPQIGSASCLT